MSDSAQDRLLAHIAAPRSSAGIGLADIHAVPLTGALVADVISCLRAEDPVALMWGLYFLADLGSRAEFRPLAGPHFDGILQQARTALRSDDARVASAAIGACGALREFYPDYAEVMRTLLTEPDSNKMEILRRAPYFLSTAELDLLRPLQDDPTVGETGGMGGPQRFYVRDFALHVAEQLAGRKFPAPDCFELQDGEQVSWRSWAPFLNWLDRKKSWWRFWR